MCSEDLHVHVCAFFNVVYTLWQVPEMLRCVTIWPRVLPKLQGGAGKHYNNFNAFFLELTVSKENLVNMYCASLQTTAVLIYVHLALNMFMLCIAVMDCIIPSLHCHCFLFVGKNWQFFSNKTKNRCHWRPGTRLVSPAIHVCIFLRLDASWGGES